MVASGRWVDETPTPKQVNEMFEHGGKCVIECCVGKETSSRRKRRIGEMKWMTCVRLLREKNKRQQLL